MLSIAKSGLRLSADLRNAQDSKERPQSRQGQVRPCVGSSATAGGRHSRLCLVLASGTRMWDVHSLLSLTKLIPQNWLSSH